MRLEVVDFFGRRRLVQQRHGAPNQMRIEEEGLRFAGYLQLRGADGVRSRCVLRSWTSLGGVALFSSGTVRPIRCESKRKVFASPDIFNCAAPMALELDAS